MQLLPPTSTCYYYYYYYYYCYDHHCYYYYILQLPDFLQNQGDYEAPLRPVHVFPRFVLVSRRRRRGESQPAGTGAAVESGAVTGISEQTVGVE